MTQLLAAVVCGALVALQQRINGDLGRSLHDPLLAAVVSFGTGLLLLALLVVRRPGGLRSLSAVPWWTRLGGLGGASLVAVGATAAPRIGVALLTVGFVAGTTVAALGVDVVGLAPGLPRPLTRWRVTGAVLCVAAVALSAGAGLPAGNTVLLSLVVLAGALISVQQALNGRVRMKTGALVATFVNFAVGTTALLAALLAKQVAVGVHAETWPSHWWLYTGGAIGASFIAVAAAVVPSIGVLRFGLASTAGQLAGAIALDVDRGVAATTVVAAGLTFVAVAVSGR